MCKVVSAPTSAGKTVLFDLAIVRVLHASLGPDGAQRPRALYLAPTKVSLSFFFVLLTLVLLFFFLLPPPSFLFLPPSL